MTDRNHSRSRACLCERDTANIKPSPTILSLRHSQVPLEIPDAGGFQAVAGKGVWATVRDDVIHIGNWSYVETVLTDESIDGLDAGLDALRKLEAEGKRACSSLGKPTGASLSSVSSPSLILFVPGQRR